MKILVYLQLTALLLSTALGAERELPFRGTVQAVELQVVQFPTLSVDGTGAGKGTRLGKFTMSFEAEVNLLTRIATGSIEFIAANGDSIFADFTGQSTLTGIPNVVSIVETGTITGGTGRFTDASGTFLLMRTLNQLTGVSSGSFDGTIVIQKKN